MKHQFVALLTVLLAPTLVHADSVASNKIIARRIFQEILSEGHFERALDLYAEDFVNHGRNRDVSFERDQEAARGWLQAFPDLRIGTEVIVAEGDLVAVVWRAVGTNTGEGNGLPATGRKVDGNGITVWRMDNGRAIEEWSEFSVMPLMRQLGLAPGGETLVTVAPFAAERLAGKAQPAERERNRAAVRDLFERALGEGDFQYAESLYAPHFNGHHSGSNTTAADEIEMLRELRQFAPDLSVEVTMTIAEGDLVAVIWTATGTSSGAAFGQEASGNAVSLRGMSVMRMAKGKILESWRELDRAQLTSAP